MNYGSPWGVAAEQVKEKNNFIFFEIIQNHKLELIDLADSSPSPKSKYYKYEARFEVMILIFPWIYGNSTSV